MDVDGCGWVASCTPVWGFSGDLFKNVQNLPKSSKLRQNSVLGWMWMDVDGYCEDVGWMWMDVDGLEEDWRRGKGRFGYFVFFHKIRP